MISLHLLPFLASNEKKWVNVAINRSFPPYTVLHYCHYSAHNSLSFQAFYAFPLGDRKIKIHFIVFMSLSLIIGLCVLRVRTTRLVLHMSQSFDLLHQVIWVPLTHAQQNGALPLHNICWDTHKHTEHILKKRWKNCRKKQSPFMHISYIARAERFLLKVFFFSQVFQPICHKGWCMHSEARAGCSIWWVWFNLNLARLWSTCCSCQEYTQTNT